MLTKEERAAIAARLISYDGGILTWTNLYECLLDAPITGDVSLEEDSKYVLDRLIDLCDTSNMVELPVDKDGEVIHIGDVVYDDKGREWQANSLTVYDDAVTVEVRSDYVRTVYRSDMLSHKQPAKTSALSKQIRDVISSAFTMPDFAAKRLSRIADQLESLGDSDD